MPGDGWQIHVYKDDIDRCVWRHGDVTWSRHSFRPITGKLSCAAACSWWMVDDGKNTTMKSIRLSVSAQRAAIDGPSTSSRLCVSTVDVFEHTKSLIGLHTLRSVLKPKFHYADFATKSLRLCYGHKWWQSATFTIYVGDFPPLGSFSESRQNGIWA